MGYLLFTFIFMNFRHDVGEVQIAAIHFSFNYCFVALLDTVAVAER